MPASHATLQVEGWAVRVDDRLREGSEPAAGERAIRPLTARPVGISVVVPEASLARLREVPIQLDLTHGALMPMQYHPGGGWPRANGYGERLAKCVHTPDARSFLPSFENHRQPWAVLHEPAHAYHDRVPGFGDARAIAAWKRFRGGGRYRSVLTSPGPTPEHYGPTDEKEFFAETTGACFGANDFYPFVAGELKQAEPQAFALLREIRGPLPEREGAADGETAKPVAEP